MRGAGAYVRNTLWIDTDTDVHVGLDWVGDIYEVSADPEICSVPRTLTKDTCTRGTAHDSNRYVA